MYNIEEVHCSAAIQAILQANLQLMHATVEEALQPVRYGKTDTLGLDGIPESTIAASLRHFDRGAVLVTEEIGTTSNTVRSYSRNYPPTFYLSDPTDRSSQLRDFLSDQDPSKKIGEVIQLRDTISRWEAACGAPASITGATSAITCIRYGVPINSAIVNFVTQELFVALRAGVFRLRLPTYAELDPSQITVEHIRSKGERVLFRKFEQIAVAWSICGTL